MKDNRFIELVNLYIDRQITGEEMAMLEAEMQANPRRRAVYQQYCKMHRATSMVYESFRTEGPNHQSAIAAEAGIARFESQGRRRTPWTYYATGLAAACVALVFARLNMSETSEQNFASTTLSAPSAVVPAADNAVPVAVAVSESQSKRTPIQGSNLVAERDYAAMLSAMRREDQRTFASGQIQSSQPSSLFEDGVFDSQPANALRAFRNKPTSNQQAEFAAYQFQR